MQNSSPFRRSSPAPLQRSDQARLRTAQRRKARHRGLLHRHHHAKQLQHPIEREECRLTMTTLLLVQHERAHALPIDLRTRKRSSQCPVREREGDAPPLTRTALSFSVAMDKPASCDWGASALSLAYLSRLQCLMTQTASLPRSLSGSSPSSKRTALFPSYGDPCVSPVCSDALAHPATVTGCGYLLPWHSLYAHVLVSAA
jgi:hypothetical protein